MCAEQDTDISKTKEIVDVYKYEIDEIKSINWDMLEHINICQK